MLKKYFNKLFGGKKEEAPLNKQFYSPLRVALHSTIKLDTIDMLQTMSVFHKDMKLPEGMMTVLAIGKTKVDSQEIFDFYIFDEKENEFILQVVTAPSVRGDGQEFIEGTLYHQVRNVTPLTGDQWDFEMKHIGDKTLDFSDYKYHRVWSDDYDDKIELVSFKEEVVQHQKTINYVNNYVLYNRELDIPWAKDGNKPVELLLVGVEETDDTAELVHLVGFKIAQSSIHVQ